MYKNFYSRLFIIAPNWEQSNVLSTRKWINCGILTELFNNKRNELVTQITWMNLKNMLSAKNRVHIL